MADEPVVRTVAVGRPVEVDGPGPGRAHPDRLRQGFAEDPGLPRRFIAAVRPGANLRIVRRGHVRAGDRVEVLDRPAHGVTLAEVFTIYHHDRHRSERLLDTPELAPMYPRRVHERRVKAR